MLSYTPSCSLAYFVHGPLFGSYARRDISLTRCNNFTPVIYLICLNPVVYPYFVESLSDTLSHLNSRCRLLFCNFLTIWRHSFRYELIYCLCLYIKKLYTIPLVSIAHHPRLSRPLLPKITTSLYMP